MVSRPTDVVYIRHADLDYFIMWKYNLNYDTQLITPQTLIFFIATPPCSFQSPPRATSFTRHTSISFITHSRSSFNHRDETLIVEIVSSTTAPLLRLHEDLKTKKLILRKALNHNQDANQRNTITTSYLRSSSTVNHLLREPTETKSREPCHPNHATTTTMDH